DYILPITKRKIILYLLEHDKCTFNEIPDYVKKAPSTTSSHLKDLKDAGIIFFQRQYSTKKQDDDCQSSFKVQEKIIVETHT
ncbi:MAG: transcriptional regulator, partial [Nitrososphaeraceae archaeon]